MDIVSAGAGQFGTNIVLSAKTRLASDAKFGIKPLQQFLNEADPYGGNHHTLAESEARTLLAARSLDAARDRILAARRQGSGQILSGSLQGREAPGETPDQVVLSSSSSLGSSGQTDLDASGSTDPSVLYQPAYHGSPYRFDKFTLDHNRRRRGAPVIRLEHF